MIQNCYTVWLGRVRFGMVGFGVVRRGSVRQGEEGIWRPLDSRHLFRAMPFCFS